MNNYYWNYF